MALINLDTCTQIYVVENIYVPIMSVILKQTNFDVCIVYDIDFGT